jgi:hypothetical protein
MAEVAPQGSLPPPVQAYPATGAAPLEIVVDIDAEVRKLYPELARTPWAQDTKVTGAMAGLVCFASVLGMFCICLWPCLAPVILGSACTSYWMYFKSPSPAATSLAWICGIFGTVVGVVMVCIMVVVFGWVIYYVGGYLFTLYVAPLL